MDSQRSRGGAPAASQASRVFRSQRTARPSRTGLGSRPVLASFQTWAGLMPKSSATSSAEKASFCNSPAQDPWRGLPAVRRLRTVPAVLSLAAVLSVAELACPVGIRLRLDSRMYANRRTKTAKKHSQQLPYGLQASQAKQVQSPGHAVNQLNVGNGVIRLCRPSVGCGPQ